MILLYFLLAYLFVIGLSKLVLYRFRSKLQPFCKCSVMLDSGIVEAVVLKLNNNTVLVSINNKAQEVQWNKIYFPTTLE